MAGFLRRGGDARVPTELTTSFEIMATFFVNVFYNSVYDVAVSDFRAKQEETLTDAYRNAAACYAAEITRSSRPESFKSTMNSLHLYFRRYANFKYATYADFVDGVVRLLVPEEYFSDMLPEECDETISMAVCSLVGFLAQYTTQPEMLRRLIDQRGDAAAQQVTISTMQDQGVSCLFGLRDKLFSQFMAGGGRGAEEPPELLARLKEKVCALVEEKVALEQELEEAARRAKELYAQLRAAGRLIEALRAEVVQLREVARVPVREVAREPPRELPREQLREPLREPPRAPPRELSREPPRAPEKRDLFAEMAMRTFAATSEATTAPEKRPHFTEPAAPEQEEPALEQEEPAPEAPPDLADLFSGEPAPGDFRPRPRP